MIQFDFKGKVVLVTGASRGMGAQILRQFVNAGAHGLLNFLPNEQNLADANALIHEFHSQGKSATSLVLMSAKNSKCNNIWNC